MSPLNLPTPQQAIQLGRDPGLISGLGQLGRSIQASGLAERQMRVQEDELDFRKKTQEENKKAGALKQLLDIDKERRLQAKDDLAAQVAEAERIHEQLINLPQKDAEELARSLFKDPAKAKTLQVLAPTPELLVKRVRKEQQEENLGTMKTKAMMAKEFDGVDEYLKSGKISDLTIKTDTKKVSIDVATELSKDLRQAHRVQTNTLTKQLEFATPSEKQQIIEELNNANEMLLTKSKELFIRAINGTVLGEDEEGSEALPNLPNKEEIYDMVIESLSAIPNKAQLEAELNNKDTKESFENLGIKIEDVRPILEERFDMINTINLDINKIESMMAPVSGGNISLQPGQERQNRLEQNRSKIQSQLGL